MSPLALGITDENDLAELKGTKKKKGKKIDDPDFMVSRRYFSYWIAEHLLVPANHASNPWKRCAKSGPSNSSNYEP